MSIVKFFCGVTEKRGASFVNGLLKFKLEALSPFKIVVNTFESNRYNIPEALDFLPNIRHRSKTLEKHDFFSSAQRPNAGQGLNVLRVFRSHTPTHRSQLDSSARVVISSQRPPPDSTQHSQQTKVRLWPGFEPKIPASERLQTQALDRATTCTGMHNVTNVMKWNIAEKRGKKK